MTTVMFDLDGTLLPMNADAFTAAYFSSLSKKLELRGYEPKALVDGVLRCTRDMINNNGDQTNESVFWNAFSKLFGGRVYDDIRYFDEYYATSFNDLKSYCGFNAKACDVVARLKQNGCTVAVATNPLFPMIAQKTRIAWSGVDLSDIDYITSYENSRFCKPNPKYYAEVLNALGTPAQDAVMIGNDVCEDAVAASSIGIKVFLLTDCLINRNGLDISDYPHGDFDALGEFLCIK